MNHNKIILSILFILTVAIVSINFYISLQLKTFLKNEPNLKYSTTYCNIFTNSCTIKELEILKPDDNSSYTFGLVNLKGISDIYKLNDISKKSNINLGLSVKNIYLNNEYFTEVFSEKLTNIIKMFPSLYKLQTEDFKAIINSDLEVAMNINLKEDNNLSKIKFNLNVQLNPLTNIIVNSEFKTDTNLKNIKDTNIDKIYLENLSVTQTDPFNSLNTIFYNIYLMDTNNYQKDHLKIYHQSILDINNTELLNKEQFISVMKTVAKKKYENNKVINDSKKIIPNYAYTLFNNKKVTIKLNQNKLLIDVINSMLNSNLEKIFIDNNISIK